WTASMLKARMALASSRREGMFGSCCLIVMGMERSSGRFYQRNRFCHEIHASGSGDSGKPGGLPGFCPGPLL
ncbi:MAG: hypothetical protein NTX45_00525, partial [Proteobacteria bacterium]|nr:hypothetical protein [Pseudomonadota bacterium]